MSAYKLIYWPGLPGRGEFVRLVFEEAGEAYVDTAAAADVQAVLSQIGPDNLGDADNPPPFAPPVLVHGGLTLSQTPAILAYLGQRLGLAGASPEDALRVQALALTALDCLCNEVHDCHHPVGTSLYYEDQKPESLRRSRVFVRDRLPKFLGYFEKVLRGSASGTDTPWLHGGQLSYADLVLFHCLHGTAHQFPRAVAAARASGQYARVFALQDTVQARPNIAAYLTSSRRQAYGEGIYRFYAELDVVADGN